MQFVEMIKDAPKLPGVYQMFDADGNLLYVGKAKNIAARLRQYVDIEKLSYHIRLMRKSVARVEFIVTRTESDALLLESDFIKNKKPKYNILLTDDKMYPMLMITSGEFPHLVKFRGKISQKRDVYGPYSSVSELNATIKLIQKVCRIRTCNDTYMKNRARPCLLHQIGRCSAPCMIVGANNHSPSTEYQTQVAAARQILSGNPAPVIRELSEQMRAASDAMDFESAAKIRDSISALSGTAAAGKRDLRDADFFAISMDTSPAVAIAKRRGGQFVFHQIIYPRQTGDMTASDILAHTVLWFYDGVKPEFQIITNIKTGVAESIGGIQKSAPNDPVITDLLMQISSRQKIINRDSIKWDGLMTDISKWVGRNIARADVFDNSHLFGKSPVGSMIVFSRNGFEKKEYRHFHLRDESRAGDDIGMMREFLTRTYSKASDIAGRLIIVDGGRAQWNTAMDVLRELNLEIPVVGVVKGAVRNGDEHFIMPDGRIDDTVDKTSALFLGLRRVRDEAPRFAIEFHRKTRGKAATTDALSEIEGIGGARRRALLSHFGSIARIAGADEKSIASTPGISKSIAEKIYLYFHPEMA